MPSENTYSAFKSKDCIVILHQHGHETPQTLAIFREPRNLITHERKLIGSYSFSNDAITLIDDPQHDARDILNAISLNLKNERKAVISRRLKYLASAVAGVLLASAAWSLPSHSPQDEGLTAAARQPVEPNLETILALSHTLAQSLATTIGGTTTPTVHPESINETLRHAPATEAQDMQAAIRDNRNALPTSPAEALQLSTPEASTGSMTRESAAVAQGAHVDPQVSAQTTARLQMADVLKRNADRGMFTLTLSSGHERTLYAFLDPTCAVCRSMEPAIERLTREYNVIVFPVSVVNEGGKAVEMIVPLLCQSDAHLRATGWQALFRADAGMATPGREGTSAVDAQCAKAAAAAVAVNDLGFRQFGFEGTPWVLTDTGFHLSTGLLAEPDKIDLFLKTTDSMAPGQADHFVQTLSKQE